MGEPGRGERSGTAQDRGPESGARPAEEAQGYAQPALSEVGVEPSAVKEVATRDALEFQPAASTLDLRPLDPRRNGVLAILERIERNTARSGTGGTVPTTSLAMPTRDARGRFVSGQVATSTVLDGGHQSGLRQRIARAKRIERSVERTLPETQTDAASSRHPRAGESSSDAIPVAEAEFRRSPAHRRAEAKAKAEAEVQVAAGQPERSDETVDTGSQQQGDGTPELTADQLRALPLRDDTGRFLSREEKDGMSPAQLAQARARQERQEAEKRREDGKLLSTFKQVGDSLLKEDHSATDAAGAAVGNAYYAAAKEVYQAVDDLTGEDSKARRLYEWAQAQWAKRQGDDDQGDGEAEADARPRSDADKEPPRSETLAIERQTRDAKRQHDASEKTAATELELHETNARNLGDQSDAHHDETGDAIEALTATNREGFEEVVDEIKRISTGGGGDTTIIPTRWPFGGGPGGGRPGQPRGRGRLGRLWDRVRGRTPPTPGAGPSRPPSPRGASPGGQSSAPRPTPPGGSPATPAQARPSVMSRIGDAGRGIVRGGGRMLGWAAAPIAGLMAYNATQEQLAEDETRTEEQRNAVATGSGIGAAGGGLAGAAAGGAAGAAIGSIIPFLGTAIGGVVGAAIGGYAGSVGGESAGRAVGEAVADTMDNVEDAAEASVRRREAERLREESGRAWYNPATWFSGDRSSTARQASYAGPGGGYRRSRDARHATSESLTEGSERGRVAERYESNGRGVGTISSGIDDAGGVSYGRHQLASETGTMQAFLDSREGAPYREAFAGMRAGSDAFNERYMEVVEQDADGFAQAQKGFITRTHFEPVKAYAEQAGMDTSSEAVQEALYSQSVQHSRRGNQRIIDDAMSRVGADASEAEMIEAIYDARTDYASQFASAAATTDRYAREREDVLAIAAHGQAQAEEQEVQQEMLAQAGNAPTQEPLSGPVDLAGPALATQGLDGAPRPEDSPLTLAGGMGSVLASPPNGQPMQVEVVGQGEEEAAAEYPQLAAMAQTINAEMEGRPVQAATVTSAEPRIPEQQVEPVDDRQAARALHPPPAPRARPDAGRRPGPPSSTATASAAPGATGGSSRGEAPRGGTSAPGLADVPMEFNDTVLTLMALDRI